MQKLTKKQLFLYSLLISGCIYLMVRGFWGLSGLLRGGTSYALMGLYVLFVVIAGVVGYMALRRKAAAIAAGSAAMVLLGLYVFIASVANSLWVGVGLVGVGLLAGAGVFYGWYSFLVAMKRRRLAASVVVITSFTVGAALSLAAHLVLRMSFAS